MKKKAAALLLIAAAAILLSGCGDTMKTARAALEKSGVLEHLFRSDYYPQTPFGDKCRLLAVSPGKETNYPYIGGDGREMKIAEPVYTVKYRDDVVGLKSPGFLSAKAEGGSFSDPDALTKGTLVFIASRQGAKRVYRDEKQRSFYGEQEKLEVYLYDIASGKVFAHKTFWGEDLKNRYEKYRGAETFVNYADMKAVEAWLDGYR